MGTVPLHTRRFPATPMGCAAQQLAEAVTAKQAPHEYALAEESNKRPDRKFSAVAEGLH